MSNACGSWGQDGVLLFRSDELDPALAAALSARQVATQTHLPTGIADESCSVLSLPVGAADITHPAGPEGRIYFVISGEAHLQWGSALEHSGTAGAGLAVHLPPGVPLAESNNSASEALERMLVRTD